MGTTSSRRTLFVAGALVVAAALVLLWKLRGHDEPASTPAPTPALQDHARAAQQTMPAPASGAPAVTARNNDEVDEEGNPRPQPVPVTGPTPPADTKQAAPAPAQKPFTREETIAKREADLKLLDETKTRLEADLAAARTANNASVAHDLQIRIARVTDLKKKRTTELDQIRAGGTVPQ